MELYKKQYNKRKEYKIKSMESIFDLSKVNCINFNVLLAQKKVYM